MFGISLWCWPLWPNGKKEISILIFVYFGMNADDRRTLNDKNESASTCFSRLQLYIMGTFDEMRSQKQAKRQEKSQNTKPQWCGRGKNVGPMFLWAYSSINRSYFYARSLTRFMLFFCAVFLFCQLDLVKKNTHRKMSTLAHKLRFEL